jgi:predicted ester cyclase
MTREEVVQLLGGWQAVWAKRDPVALASIYASDCTVTSPIFGEIKGRSAVEQSNRRLFAAFPDWDLKTEDLIVDGDKVVEVIKISLTHVGEFMGLPGTGRKAQIHGARIMRLENNLIKEELRVYDFTLLLMQVGVLRGKPGH